MLHPCPAFTPPFSPAWETRRLPPCPQEYELPAGAQFPRRSIARREKSLLEVVGITRAWSGSIQLFPLIIVAVHNTDRMRDYPRATHDLAKWGTGGASYAVTGAGPSFPALSGETAPPHREGFRTQAPALLEVHTRRPAGARCRRRRRPVQV